METALVLTLDDADPFDDVRREIASDTVARGIPFHVTLLYPFAPREEVTDALVEDVRAFFAEQEPFAFSLTRVATWPDVVYAVPEPDDDLRRCMYALHARYPQWPPYGGVHDVVIPHATLGEEVDAAAVVGDVTRRLAPHLPKRYVIDEATLLEEYAQARWRERERFALGRTR